MDIITTLVELKLGMQFYHWTTSSYARHLATNSFKLDTKLDEFVEVYSGEYGKLKFDNISIIIPNLNNAEAPSYLKIAMDKLSQNNNLTTELNNILDEIKAMIAKLNYLFALS